MAKRPKKKDDGSICPDAEAAILGLEMPDLTEIAPKELGGKVPPQVIDGRPNADFYRYMAAVGMQYQVRVMAGEVDARSNWNLKTFLEGVALAAKQNGLDPKSAMDTRRDAQIQEDLVHKLVENADSILETVTPVLEGIVRTLDKIEGFGTQYMEEQLGRYGGAETVGKLKRMFQMTLDIRHRVKEKVPKISTLDAGGRQAAHKWRDVVLEATHTARFMVYAIRSTMAGKRGADSILKIGMHHVRILADIWAAENGVYFHKPRLGELHGEIERDREKYPYIGVCEAAPPGHGKTTCAHGWVGLRLALNQDEQGTWLHDLEKRAAENVEFVKDMFRPDNDMGRRVLSLFPHIRLAKTWNGNGELTFDTGRKLVGRNLVGRSVFGSAQGMNNSFQVRDDIVPPTDEHEPSVRERRYDMVQSQWEQRLRGANAFRVNVGTMLHHEDALSKFFNSAKRKSNPVWMLTRVQPCRRVLHSGKARYIPLWPEMYPARTLAQKFDSLDNKHHWYCHYECNPHPEASRLVKKLRYYDPNLDESHVFMKSSEGHVSMDPAWTKERKSDHAGLVVVAKGVVHGVVKQPDGSEVWDTETQIRLAVARSEQSTALGLRDLLERVVEDAEGMGISVNHVYVEANGAGAAIIEQLDNEYGFDVIKCSATRSKPDRFRDVMLMFDDSRRDKRACVLFPGRAVRDDDGNLKIDETGDVVVEQDPDWEWLYRQFLDFGMHNDDHCLDATVQVCNRLSADVTPGRGVVSKLIAAKRNEDPLVRQLRIYNEQIRRPRDTTGWESEFTRGNW